MSSSSPSPATTWQFYTDADSAWNAMLEACDKATTTIDLEQFIFVNDEVGQRFLSVLSKKAAQGVKVRVLCDAAGSLSFLGSTLINSLEAEGMEVVFFNTFIPGTLRNHTLWFFRDHRKLTVIDNKIGFTGSMCLTSEVKTWRDVHVRIEGEVVAEMAEAFTSMWSRAHKRKYTKKNVGVGIDGFNYITNSPLPGRRFLYYRLVDAIRNAKKYVYLSTPYFVPDRRFMRVIRLAAKRGVDVRLIVPEKSDHPVVDLGARTLFDKLLSSGVKVYEFQNRVIHSKYAVIDDDWATVGSMNYDNVSFLYNFEANLVSTNRHFVLDTKQLFFQDLNATESLSLAVWRDRPVTRRFLEWLVMPLRNFL